VISTLPVLAVQFGDVVLMAFKNTPRFSKGGLVLFILSVLV